MVSQEKKMSPGEERVKSVIAHYESFLDRNAVLAILSGNLFCTAMLANKDICSKGRIRFTNDGMKMMNPDGIGIMIVSCVLNLRAFEKYVCKPEEVNIDCDFNDMCAQLKKKNASKSVAVILIPNSRRENGMYGPLELRFINIEGLNYEIKYEWCDLSLEVQQLNPPPMEYMFDLTLSFKDFKEIMNNLFKDKSADRVRISSTHNCVTFKNENGITTVNQSIILPIQNTDLDYKFSAETDRYDVLVSRRCIKAVLSVPNIEKCDVRIRAAENVFAMKLYLPMKRGAVQFYQATMLESDE